MTFVYSSGGMTEVINTCIYIADNRGGIGIGKLRVQFMKALVNISVFSER